MDFALNFIQKGIMRNIWIFAMILFTSCGRSQPSNLIIEKLVISDFSEFPVYSLSNEEVDGKRELKENFKYLDSVEISSITYFKRWLKK